MNTEVVFQEYMSWKKCCCCLPYIWIQGKEL